MSESDTDALVAAMASHLAVQMKDAGEDEAADYMMSEWIAKCIRAVIEAHEAGK